MTDALGAAPAAAPVSDALPVGNDAVSAPNAINNDGGPSNVDPAPEPAAAGKKPVSIDDAIDRATAKVEKDAAAPGDAKDLGKGAQLERDKTTGKFAPKDPAAAAAAAAAVKPGAVDPAAAKPGEVPAAKPAAVEKPAVDPNAPKSTAPARFSEDAKAVWDTAPEPVKAEVARMERELTQGIEKHRVSAAKFDHIKEFDELATKSGTDLKTALTKYVNLETLLRQNPLRGIEEVCNNIGVSLKDVARIVLEQPADQQQSQSDATIRELKQQLDQLKQQVGGVTQNFQQQQQTALHDHIAKWAESRPHFELYAPHIAAEMREGAANLDDAEARVFQKYPALAALAKQGAKPAPSNDPDPAEASAAAAADLEAQTRKGQKSITGAPGPGSNPAARKRSKSIDDAIDAAFAAAG
jgi:DNA-binding transcriptional MerR regulator